MPKSLIAPILAASFSATTAFAGGIAAPIVDIEPVVAVAAKSFDWSGGYVGAHIGYGDGTVEDVNNSGSSKHDTDGFLGGIQVGYNWQLANRIVLGVEADLSVADIKEKWVDGAYFGEDKHKLSGSLRGRIGYAYERFLPYLHGGVAWSRNEHMLGCESPSPFSSCVAPGFERQESDTVTGYVLGAGLEYAIDQRWSIKGEYAYTNYGKNKLVLVDPNFPDNPVNNRNFETKNHTLKLGVNYRF